MPPRVDRRSLDRRREFDENQQTGTFGSRIGNKVPHKREKTLLHAHVNRQHKCVVITSKNGGGAQETMAITKRIGSISCSSRLRLPQNGSPPSRYIGGTGNPETCQRHWNGNSIPMYFETSRHRHVCVQSVPPVGEIAGHKIRNL